MFFLTSGAVTYAYGALVNDAASVVSFANLCLGLGGLFFICRAGAYLPVVGEWFRNPEGITELELKSYVDDKERIRSFPNEASSPESPRSARTPTSTRLLAEGGLASAALSPESPRSASQTPRTSAKRPRGGGVDARAAAEGEGAGRPPWAAEKEPVGRVGHAFAEMNDEEIGLPGGLVAGWGASVNAQFQRRTFTSEEQLLSRTCEEPLSPASATPPQSLGKPWSTEGHSAGAA
jgi:hypothetical protein